MPGMLTGNSRSRPVAHRASVCIAHIAFAALLFSVHSSPAASQSAGDILKSAGLIGPWSTDCGLKPGEPLDAGKRGFNSFSEFIQSPDGRMLRESEGRRASRFVFDQVTVRVDQSIEIHAHLQDGAMRGVTMFGFSPDRCASVGSRSGALPP